MALPAQFTALSGEWKGTKSLYLNGESGPVRESGSRLTIARAAREAEYKARFANPFVAGSRGFIDDVVLPHETRQRICRSLAMLKDKKLDNTWRKHGNIPL